MRTETTRSPSWDSFRKVLEIPPRGHYKLVAPPEGLGNLGCLHQGLQSRATQKEAEEPAERKE
jgi:hypothetical protein